VTASQKPARLALLTRLCVVLGVAAGIGLAAALMYAGWSSKTQAVPVRAQSASASLNAQEVQALAEASEQEQIRLLSVLIGRLYAPSATSTTPSLFAPEVVQGFLNTLKRRQVPIGDWPQALQELTRQFLVLGERSSGVVVMTDRAKTLLAQADMVRKAGNLERLDPVMAQLNAQAALDMSQAQQQLRRAQRQSAGLLATQAALAFARLERKQGATLLEQAADVRRDDVDSEVLAWLLEAGDVWRAQGQDAQALALYRKAQQAVMGHAQLLQQRDLQRDLATCHNKVGDVLRDQGSTVAALQSYQAGLEVRQQLWAAAPDDRALQRELSASHDRVGDVQRLLGDFAAALKSYQTGMALRQALTASDPADGLAQRELSVSYNKVGDVQQDLHRPSAALTSYQAGLAIVQALAQAQPEHHGWQRDLSVSYERIGDVLRAQGEFVAARQSYLEAMTIRQALAVANPGHTEWQLDVVVCYWKLTQMGTAAGTLEQRRAWLSQGLYILHSLQAQQRLAPARAVWIQVFSQTLASLPAPAKTS